MFGFSGNGFQTALKSIKQKDFTLTWLSPKPLFESLARKACFYCCPKELT